MPRRKPFDIQLTGDLGLANDYRSWIHDLLSKSNLDPIKIKLWFSDCDKNGDVIYAPTALKAKWINANYKHELVAVFGEKIKCAHKK